MKYSNKKINYFKKLEKKMDREYINAILEVLNKECPSIRTPKYTNIYYLYHIVLVLTDLKKWESLHLLYNDLPEYHYKTIQDKHLLWSELNIYEIAYKILFNKYKLPILKNSSNLILFIDSTLIYNKNGSECIGYGQNPKKKETKISAICDKNKTLYSIDICNINHKTVTKNTLKDDAHTVETSLQFLLKNKLKYKKIILVGDKGYARTQIDRQSIRDLFNVELLYPHKKNQKIKTPSRTKQFLKNRYVIENVFSTFKNFDRICLRKDKSTSSFKGFLYLASIIKFKK